MMNDLLTEKLIQTDVGWHSLPGLFSAMTRGEVQGLPALRPHQRPAWHMFTVQLAVLALDAAGLRDLPEDEDTWREALLRLTPDAEAWSLVGNPVRPAFLQPADPGGLKWTDVTTPDALDMLITSRNHDIKREIAHNAAPQDWLFALVSLQTMEGFGGAGNYGIARMNGGSSSRVLLGLAPARPGSSDIDPSAWWRRDTLCLLAGRQGITGKSLIWMEPWPEGRSLNLDELDPLFIEICRRIRLVQRGGRLMAQRSTSKAARIAAKEAMGNTADPWAPIDIAIGKSLTLGDRDFDHDLLVRLLFAEKPEWKAPPLMARTPAEAAAPMLIVAEAIARGNSKTDGFKSRVVPVPKAMVAQGLFGERPVEVASDLMKDIAAINLALRNGLATVAAGGDREKLGKSHYSRAKPACDAFHRCADAWFFDALWTMALGKRAEDLRAARLDFIERLVKCARAEFEAALSAIPCASLMRPKAEIRGRQRLESGLHFAMRNLKEESINA